MKARIAGAVLLLVFACTIGAQEDDALEKYWIVFMTVHDEPDKAAWNLQQSGISEEGANALAVYVTQAFADLDASIKQSVKDLCDRKTALRASGAALADALKSADENYTAARRGYVNNLGVVLNDDDERKLRDWVVRQRAPNDAPSSNLDARLRSGQVDVTAKVDRLCNPSNSR